MNRDQAGYCSGTEPTPLIDPIPLDPPEWQPPLELDEHDYDFDDLTSAAAPYKLGLAAG